MLKPALPWLTLNFKGNGDVNGAWAQNPFGKVKGLAYSLMRLLTWAAGAKEIAEDSQFGHF
eukprot:7899675-Karenia_brevis.AAC.1